MTKVAKESLMGLTPRGWFHIQWLHLNRPQLIERRKLENQEQELRESLIQAKETTFQLQNRLRELEPEIVELQVIFARLAY